MQSDRLVIGIRSPASLARCPAIKDSTNITGRIAALFFGLDMIADLPRFKTYMRELTDDLDGAFTFALESAAREVNAYLGFDVEVEYGADAPADILMGCVLLAHVHAEPGDVEMNEHRVAAAHRLLSPYRKTIGFRCA